MDVMVHEEAILQSFASYHLLTVDQVTRLHYSHGSSRYVSALLKAMTEKRLLFRPERESVNYPYVYMLGSRGVKYLRKIGMEDVLFHPSEHKRPSRLHVQHALTVNDVLIACSGISSVCPGYSLYGMKHDLTLKRQLKEVVPDGWVDIRREHEQYCFWLEVDRGTMEQKRIREKIRLIVQFAKQDYERVFGTPSLTVLFMTSAGERRRDTLLVWCEKELVEMREQNEADLFRFTAISQQGLDPTWLFFTPIWLTPFQKEQTVLCSCD